MPSLKLPDFTQRRFVSRVIFAVCNIYKFSRNSCKTPSGRNVPSILDGCCSFLMYASVTFPSLTAHALKIKFLSTVCLSSNCYLLSKLCLQKLTQPVYFVCCDSPGKGYLYSYFFAALVLQRLLKV